MRREGKKWEGKRGSLLCREKCKNGTERMGRKDSGKVERDMKGMKREMYKDEVPGKKRKIRERIGRK